MIQSEHGLAASAQSVVFLYRSLAFGYSAIGTVQSTLKSHR